MKTLILTLLVIISINYNAQGTVSNLKNINPKNEYQNIHAHKISSDSLSTTFVIWIKQKVKLHKHVYHTENVVIHEGSGVFQLKDSLYTVSAGDVIIVPKNTWHGLVTNSESPMKVISIQSPEFLGEDRVYKN